MCNVEVDESHKKSACSTSSPPAYLTLSTNATHDYIETDADLWGGSGNVIRSTMAQSQSITSSFTAKRPIPTQKLATCHIYAQVDCSKKKLRRGGDS